MRGNELLDKMELVDPAYVEAAGADGKKSRKLWLKWGTAVACLSTVILVGVIFRPQEQNERDPNLPMLTVSERQPDGMGFEGYMAFDVDELVNANPWSADIGLTVLPVYRNALYADGWDSVETWSKMRELLLDVAERLGLEADSLVITDNAPDEETLRKWEEKYQSAGEEVPAYDYSPTALIARSEGVEIEVDQNLIAKISFEPSIALPEQYNFTHYADYTEKKAVAEYLLNEYRDLIGFDDPQMNIYGGDYNIRVEQGYQIEFFAGNEEKKEQIVNCQFNRVAFYCDDEGKLFLARIFAPDLSHKAGDYPIISPERAEELLLDGKGITTVPYDIAGKKYVKKVELVYRKDNYAEYFMPYYRFYVELPEMERENGLKNYGIYYVPAVEEIYLTDMPVWDGRFN